MGCGASAKSSEQPTAGKYATTLDSQDPEVRAKGVASAGLQTVAIRDSGGRPLVRALVDPSEHVQREAIETLDKLGKDGAEAVAPGLGEHARTGDLRVRMQAVAVLERIGVYAPQFSTPHLLDAAGDELFQVGEAAAIALSRTSDANAVRPLVRNLATEIHKMICDRRARDEAKKRLQALGSLALLELTSMLRDGDPETKQVAAQGLMSLQPGIADPAVPALIQALGDAKPEVRSAAAMTLGFLSESAAAPAVPELARLIHEEGAANSPCYILALRQLGQAATPAVPTLRETMRNTEADALLLSQMAEVLGNVGAAALPAIPELALVCGHRDPIASEKARAVLVGLGDAAKPMLEELRNDEDVQIRMGVVASFASLSHVEHLLQALDDSSWEVRRVAASGLGDLGVADVPGAKELGNVVASHQREPEDRVAAAQCLRCLRAGAAPAISQLVKVLMDDMAALHIPDQSQVQIAVAYTLGATGEEGGPAVPALVRALGSTNPALRTAGGQALAELCKHVPAAQEVWDRLPAQLAGPWFDPLEADETAQPIEATV
mmetsp:Transcript_89032/g.177120  ORF Transcript_89032/g.177120 Transcript_89032/m.177120 type:complete len:552 (+) Transcript_89032:122-1777(+)